MKRIVSFLCAFIILLTMLSSMVLPVTAATELTNLWNYASEYNGTTGNLGGNTNYYTSKELIPVSAGDVVTFGVNIAGSQNYQLALYDSSKAFTGYIYTADLTRLLQYITGVWENGKPIELFYSDTVPSIVL